MSDSKLMKPKPKQYKPKLRSAKPSQKDIYINHDQSHTQVPTLNDDSDDLNKENIHQSNHK